MLRCRHLRGFVALLTFVVGLAVSDDARADDPIDVQGLSPEMLGALGGSVPPEMLAALMAAMNGSRAAETALPTAGGGDPTALSSMLDGVDAQHPVSGTTATTHGGVVDIHPGETSGHGPERIVAGHSAGIVDLHPSVASAAPEPTTLPTVRVAPRAPRRGHGPRSTTPHDVHPHAP